MTDDVVVVGRRYNHLKRRLEIDPSSCDLLFSLLVAALSNYRHDTVLRPFPPMYNARAAAASSSSSAANDPRRTPNNNVDERRRDYDALRSDVASCPNFRALDENIGTTNTRLLELLLWTIDTKQFTLKTCSRNKFSEICLLTGHTIDVAAPDFIFEVDYSQAAEERFNALRNDRSVIFAYHGSRLENFHSILHFGLQGHLNKNSVFGEGTYLSSELSISIHYSPMGFAWDRSLLGHQLGCIAVCEIIDDPSVKCKMHENRRGGQEPSNSRARIVGSIGGDVPEKYYVVRNNDIIRVKYLLVYAQRNNLNRRAILWIQKYKFAVVLVLYVVFLILLGLFRSVSIRSFFKSS